MLISDAQHYVQACFQMAANNKDKDALFAIMADAELAAIEDGYFNLSAAPLNPAIRTALRVMDVVQIVTGEKIERPEITAYDIALDCMSRMKMDQKQLPDALISSAKAAWDYALADVKMSGDTTLAQLAQRWKKFELAFQAS